MEPGGDAGHFTAGFGGGGLPRDAAGSIKSRLYSYGPQKPNALLSRPGAIRPRASVPQGQAAPMSGGTKQNGHSTLPKVLQAKAGVTPAPRPPGAVGPAAMSRSFGDNIATFSSAKPSSGVVTAADGTVIEAAPIPLVQLKRRAEAAEEARKRMVRAPPTDAADDPARARRSGNGVDDTANANEASKQPRRNDPFWFIQMLRTELSNNEFAYMNVADTEGTSFDPYNLRIVPFNEVNESNHYTISEAGVTHCFRKGNQEFAEFTPLEQWENECYLFQEVMEIPFFKRCARGAACGAPGALGRARGVARQTAARAHAIARAGRPRSLARARAARAGTTRGSRTTCGRRTSSRTRSRCASRC